MAPQKHKLSVKNRFFGMMMKMQEKIDQLEARISVGDVLTAKQAEELERLREELALAMHRMVENDIRWREAQEVQRIKTLRTASPRRTHAEFQRPAWARRTSLTCPS